MIYPNKLLAPALCLFVCLMALPAFPAQAHRLNVFAWLESGEIMVECNFGNNRPAIDARITVLDKDSNQVLVRGVTDRTGHFAFPVPGVVREGHTLAIDVNAGDGHRSEWIMPASEIYAGASLAAGFDQENVDLQQQRQAQAKPGTATPPQNLSPVPGRQGSGPAVAQRFAPQALAPEHLRIIVREELEQQLAPMRRELAARTSSEPGFAEIIGGLGWIVGIVGIVLFCLSRRKQA